jgi:hypothetical protein
MNTMCVNVPLAIRRRGGRKDQVGGGPLYGAGSAVWRRAVATPAQSTAVGSSFGLLTIVTSISARSRSCIKRTTTSPSGVGRRTVPPRRSESRSSAYSPLPASCMRTNTASVMPENTYVLDTFFCLAPAGARIDCIPPIGRAVGLTAATARLRRDGLASRARESSGIVAESRRGA